MRKILKKMALSASICAIAVTGTIPVLAAEGVATQTITQKKQPSIKGKAGIIMDAKSGKILYAKKIDDRHYPASITKILTTLVAIENNKDLYGEVTFSSHAVNSLEHGSTHIGIKAGEKMPLIDVLHGIMLESANEACNGAAEYTAGSEEKFVDLMNKKAQELGCTNSHFVTTNGLHNDQHYVTARDMAKISQAALKNSTFRLITEKANYYIPKTNKDKKGRSLWNHHKMIKRTRYIYDGVEGGKTGYTTKAGGTLVTFAKRGDQELICVDLCAHGAELYEDTIKMFDYAFQNYYTIVPFRGIERTLKDDKYGILSVGNRVSPYTLPLKHLEDITIMLEKDEQPSNLSYRCNGKYFYVSYNKKQIGKATFH